MHGARGPEYERIGGNAPVWYLYDGLGSVLGTVDGSGNIVSTRKYDVYGSVRASTGPGGTKHKFVGQLGHPSEDETGLIYMRARYMDPVIGRFVSEDPARDGFNWYSYVACNPTSKGDTSGKRVEDAFVSAWKFGLANTFANLLWYFFQEMVTAPGGHDANTHLYGIIKHIGIGAKQFLAGWGLRQAGGEWAGIGTAEMLRGGASIAVGVVALMAFTAAKTMAIYYILEGACSLTSGGEIT